MCFVYDKRSHKFVDSNPIEKQTVASNPMNLAHSLSFSLGTSFVNMLAMCFVLEWYIYCALIMTKDHISLLIQTQFRNKPFHPKHLFASFSHVIAIYYVSIVDKETHFGLIAKCGQWYLTSMCFVQDVGVLRPSMRKHKQHLVL